MAHAEGIQASSVTELLGSELPSTPSPGVVRISNPSLPVWLPLISQMGELVGWLALGPHPDGSLYGRDDRRALEELSPPLARALLVALERSHRDAEREFERRALAERLAQLEETLAKVAAPSRESGAT